MGFVAGEGDVHGHFAGGAHVAHGPLHIVRVLGDALLVAPRVENVHLLAAEDFVSGLEGLVAETALHLVRLAGRPRTMRS